MIVSGHNNSCWGTNLSGHKRVSAQTCLGTNVCGLSHVVTVVWAQSCMSTNVVEPYNTIYFFSFSIYYAELMMGSRPEMI